MASRRIADDETGTSYDLRHAELAT